MGCKPTRIAPAVAAPKPGRFQVLQMPREIWRHISEFEGSRTISHVCHAAWAMLQHRVLSCHANGPLGPKKLESLGERTRSLVVHCGQAAPVASGVHLLHPLWTSTTLRDLRLYLRDNKVSDSHVAVLGALAEAPALTNLVLDLRYAPDRGRVQARHPRPAQQPTPARGAHRTLCQRVGYFWTHFPWWPR